MSQLEHILLRPDSYVGSIEWQRDKLWIYDSKKNEVAEKDVDYVPGLFKIFDEVLVNANDNFVRDRSQTYIKVEIDEKAGRVSVENNGQSLPIQMHQEHDMFVPEMVFGHLLTGDNYDDDEKKVTGGRNGYGAKLANIFSTKFEVECVDAERQKKYQQTWQDNMKTKGKPSVSASKGDSYTKVTFYPDFPRFGMKKLDKDIVGLMQRRCLDIAGTTPPSLKVFLNGKQLAVKDFEDYVEMYTSGNDAAEVIHERISDRWEVAVTVSEGQFKQVSFVNGIATTKGGTHVTHVAEQIIDSLVKKANKQNKGGMEIKNHNVKNYLWIFVNCLIENPTFDSQTKETMTLKQAKFGSKCDVTESIITKVLKTGIIDMILQWAKAKEAIDLGKAVKATATVTSGKRKRLHIPKLEDANLAGGREGPSCTLILTEGDSAKSLAMAGLSIIGRDRYGVFPLRGKLLNVRDANHQQTMANAEITSITKILGIEPKKNYQSTQGMRYGHLMIMTDQDYDGSHIKGLILNLVQHWWPGLFAKPGFLQEFVTPIVKVTKRGQVQQFFTMGEYEKFKEENNNGRGWHCKYYKGLGTSTTAEAKEYFKNIDSHSLNFESCGDKSQDNELIDMAFNKKRADDRKEWMNEADDEAFVDHSQANVSFSDFVKKELVHFAKYDTMRSIPSAVDGFKPVQRKIMWAAFKRNLKSDTKVAQLSGYVSEKSSYHHGEVSLQGAIISLAQNYVGSNNVHLLTPSGQFGTRLAGGKDHASARYIYTKLEQTARLIFHPDDDAILHYLNDEGLSIEPRWYMPIIPMVLCNGAEGIGTGWATWLPNYNPRDIIMNLKRYMRCQPMDEMCPWYRGFKGSIVPCIDKDGYECIGIIEKRGPATLEITELPVKKTTQDYKEMLQGMLSTEGVGSGQIEDFKEYHTETSVHFIVTVTEAQMAKHESAGFEKVFKVKSSLPTSNMIFFDKGGRIRKFTTELEIIEYFAELRLEYYQKRKDHLLRRLRQQCEILSEKVRFIKQVISEKLKVKNRKKEVLIQDLRKMNFRTMQEICEGDDTTHDQEADQQDGQEEGAKKEKRSGGWEYLLGMPLWSLTMERVLDLERQLKEKQAEIKALEELAPEEIWDKDLNALLKALDDLEATVNKSAAEEARLKNAALKRAALGSSLAGKRGRGSLAEQAAASSAVAAMAGGVASGESASARLLKELQERQLARTVVDFPGLFDDLAPEAKRRAVATKADAIEGVVGSAAKKTRVK